jgi:hypothetical protein
MAMPLSVWLGTPARGGAAPVPREPRPIAVFVLDMRVPSRGASPGLTRS